MAERPIRSKPISRIERALKSAAVAEKGNVACIDLGDGALVPVSVATDLLPIGWFEESLTGDGTTPVGVKLFKEIEVVLLPNAGSGAVDDGDVGNVCYLTATAAVTMTSTGASVAGRVWGVSGTNVLVEMAISMGIQGIQGEPGV
jgi:hypothetical protein